MREQTDPLEDLDTAAIEAVLREAPVVLAVVYGSHARGEATAASDVGIAVAFERTLSSVARTRTRFRLIERLGAALDTDDIDVVPLVEAPPELQREICEDGVVLGGDRTTLEQHCPPDIGTKTREERLADLDDLLTEMDRVV